MKFQITFILISITFREKIHLSTIAGSGWGYSEQSSYPAMFTYLGSWKVHYGLPKKSGGEFHAYASGVSSDERAREQHDWVKTTHCPLCWQHQKDEASTKIYLCVPLTVFSSGHDTNPRWSTCFYGHTNLGGVDFANVTVITCPQMLNSDFISVTSSNRVSLIAFRSSHAIWVTRAWARR